MSLAFTLAEVLEALNKMKADNAPGYHNIHLDEFPKHLGLNACSRLSKLFVGITVTNIIRKM